MAKKIVRSTVREEFWTKVRLTRRKKRTLSQLARVLQNIDNCSTIQNLHKDEDPSEETKTRKKEKKRAIFRILCRIPHSAEFCNIAEFCAWGH